MKPYMVDKVESADGDTVKFNVPYDTQGRYCNQRTGRQDR